MLMSFLLTPLREGRLGTQSQKAQDAIISTHAPAGGATEVFLDEIRWRMISTHAPAGGATGLHVIARGFLVHISTHAPAGGATRAPMSTRTEGLEFLLTPLREGRPRRYEQNRAGLYNFYSRPCGRGDWRRLWLQ